MRSSSSSLGKSWWALIDEFADDSKQSVERPSFTGPQGLSAEAAAADLQKSQEDIGSSSQPEVNEHPPSIDESGDAMLTDADNSALLLTAERMSPEHHSPVPLFHSPVKESASVSLYDVSGNATTPRKSNRRGSKTK